MDKEISAFLVEVALTGGHSFKDNKLKFAFKDRIYEAEIMAPVFQQQPRVIVRWTPIPSKTHIIDDMEFRMFVQKYEIYFGQAQVMRSKK